MLSRRHQGFYRDVAKLGVQHRTLGRVPFCLSFDSQVIFPFANKQNGCGIGFVWGKYFF